MGGGDHIWDIDTTKDRVPDERVYRNVESADSKDHYPHIDYSKLPNEGWFKCTKRLEVPTWLVLALKQTRDLDEVRVKAEGLAWNKGSQWGIECFSGKPVYTAQDLLKIMRKSSNKGAYERVMELAHSFDSVPSNKEGHRGFDELITSRYRKKNPKVKKTKSQHAFKFDPLPELDFVHIDVRSGDKNLK